MDTPKLPQSEVRVQRAIKNSVTGFVKPLTGFVLATVFVTLACVSSCSSLPKVEHKVYRFPPDAYVGDVKRPYNVLGLVKSKIDYQTLDPNYEEKDLCKNYYNKAVTDLVARARKKGADAVIDVKSVVFLEDGKQEFYKTPECADDGQEGQILAQGIAVHWKPVPDASPSPR